MRDLLMQWLTRNWGMFVLLAVWYIAIIPFAIFSLPPFLPGHDIHNLTWYLGLAFIYSFLAQSLWNRLRKRSNGSCKVVVKRPYFNEKLIEECWDKSLQLDSAAKS